DSTAAHSSFADRFYLQKRRGNSDRFQRQAQIRKKDKDPFQKDPEGSSHSPSVTGFFQRREKFGIQDADVGAVHAQRAGFHHAGAFQFPQGVDDHGAGDADAVGDFAGHQQALISVQLVEDVFRRLQLAEGEGVDRQLDDRPAARLLFDLSRPFPKDFHSGNGGSVFGQNQIIVDKFFIHAGQDERTQMIPAADDRDEGRIAVLKHVLHLNGISRQGIFHADVGSRLFHFHQRTGILPRELPLLQVLLHPFVFDLMIDGKSQQLPVGVDNIYIGSDHIAK